MAKVKVGFVKGDRVYYKTVSGEKVTAEIIAVHNAEIASLTEYEIRVTTNRAKTYRKGEKFRTTGAWLIKR